MRNTGRGIAMRTTTNLLSCGSFGIPFRLYRSRSFAANEWLCIRARRAYRTVPFLFWCCLACLACSLFLALWLACSLFLAFGFLSGLSLRSLSLSLSLSLSRSRTFFRSISFSLSDFSLASLMSLSDFSRTFLWALSHFRVFL